MYIRFYYKNQLLNLNIGRNFINGGQGNEGITICFYLVPLKRLTIVYTDNTSNHVVDANIKRFIFNEWCLRNMYNNIILANMYVTTSDYVRLWQYVEYQRWKGELNLRPTMPDFKEDFWLIVECVVFLLKDASASKSSINSCSWSPKIEKRYKKAKKKSYILNLFVQQMHCITYNDKVKLQ